MILCTNCHRPYPETGIPYKCPACGGLFDYDSFPISLDASPSDRHISPLTLGEGNTPLVWSDFTPIPGQRSSVKIAFKCEYQNPTGSFKDRGSATLVEFLRSRGVTEAIEDSSGNAGASFAAYAARAGIKATVYVPESASGPKRRQIEAYGAEIIAVTGPRSNAADAVRRAADKGAVYASHAYLPFNLPGYATIASEIVEQLGGAPGSFICPAGQGGLLLGAARGFAALHAAGVIPHTPKLFGVQALACAPLWALAKYGPAGLGFAAEGPTLAEGVRVRLPLRGDAIVRAVEASGGAFAAVAEEDILPGRDALARQGFYVEATSAIVWNALAQLANQLVEPVVVVLTGSGLKSNQ